MFKNSLIVLLVFIQLTVLLLTANFYFAPKVLSSHCVSSESSSKELGNGVIVDCIACYQQSSGILASREFNQIAILIPHALKNQKNLNLNDSFQFLPEQQANALKEQFLYNGAAFFQNECQHFQCLALHQPNDLALTQPNNFLDTAKWSKITSFGLKQRSAFGIHLFNSSFSAQKYRILSAALSSQSKHNSMVLRFRYNVVSNIDPQFEPVFLLYSNENSIFMRLLLLAPLLLSLYRILGNLFHNQVAKYILYIAFFSGILSQPLFTIAAAISVYLVMGEMIGKLFLGILIGLIYLIVAVAFNYQVISILVLCLATFLIVIAMFGLQEKNRESYQNIAIIVIVSFNILLALVLNWSTLAFAAVFQFLACFTPYTDHKTQSKSSYRGVHNQQLEEQQDMVVRIDRQLGHH